MSSRKQKKVTIQTSHLFPVLDKMLLKLLRSLTEEEWEQPTIAKLWSVKDIAAHLLDGNLRGLSIARDGHMGDLPINIQSYQDLVGYLNGLNHGWTGAAKRLSPRVIVNLLETTGKQYNQYLKKLSSFEDAIFPVAWAGHTVSPNWFHTAREYTEKFLHQQQIRDAVGKQALFTKKLYYPFLDTFMQALPHAYNDALADTGSIVSVIVTGKAGGEWHIIKKEEGWKLAKKIKESAAATVNIDPYDAWKIFSKGMPVEEALTKVTIKGKQELGKVALQMVAVMA